MSALVTILFLVKIMRRLMQGANLLTLLVLLLFFSSLVPMYLLVAM